MALSLQKKLELAGELSKVQPLLQQLHVLKKRKERHRVRNAILVSGAIGAVAAFLVVMCRRRGCEDGALAGDEGDMQAGSPIEDTPPAESDSRGIPDVGE